MYGTPEHIYLYIQTDMRQISRPQRAQATGTIKPPTLDLEYERYISLVHISRDNTFHRGAGFGEIIASAAGICNEIKKSLGGF